MRCTQIMGLSPRALAFLEEYAMRIPKKQCPTCGHVTGGEMAKSIYASAVDKGMYDDGPDLHQYQMKDGGILQEIVQAVIWSSGPMIFLCLQDKDGNKRFQWSEKELAGVA